MQKLRASERDMDAYACECRPLSGGRSRWACNTSAMASGASRDRVAARLVHMFHAANVAVRASTWFEYVPSAANVSDLPSRNEFAWLHARGSVPLPLRWPSPAGMGSLIDAAERFTPPGRWRW